MTQDHFYLSCMTLAIVGLCLYFGGFMSMVALNDPGHRWSIRVSFVGAALLLGTAAAAALSIPFYHW